MVNNMVFGKKLNGAEEYIPFKYEPGMIRLDANESYADMPDEMKNKVLINQVAPPI